MRLCAWRPSTGRRCSRQAAEGWSCRPGGSTSTRSRSLSSTSRRTTRSPSSSPSERGIMRLLLTDLLTLFSLRHSLHFIRFDHPNSSAINLGTSDNPFGLVALTANARQAPTCCRIIHILPLRTASSASCPEIFPREPSRHERGSWAERSIVLT